MAEIEIPEKSCQECGAIIPPDENNSKMDQLKFDSAGFKTKTFDQKIDDIDQFNATIVDFVNQTIFSSGKTIQLSELNETLRVISGITKNMQSSAFKKKEIEQKDEIDFNHRKIETAFRFLIEAVLHSMNDVGINEHKQNEFSMKLSKKLLGFEERLNNSIGKAHISAIDTIANPLVDLILVHDKIKES